MMTAKQLAEKAEYIARHCKSVYMWGVVCSPVTEQLVRDKSGQYKSWYTSAQQKRFRSLIGKGYWGCDCVCLIKAILWGWTGANVSLGGAKYASNGVPDINADTIISVCKDVSTDFSKIEVGEALWMPGHIGVYIGNGLGVECTPAFADGIQVTAVGNIGCKATYPTRVWKKHGKLPYVTYEPAKIDAAYEAAKQTLRTKVGLAETTIQYLAAYKYGKDLITKLAAAVK